MKHRFAILNILMLVPIFITIICLFFLPDRVPVHFDQYMVPDRWGSKYEYLMFPIFTLVFGQFLKEILKSKEKGGSQKDNKSLFWLVAGTLLLFDVISVIMIASTNIQAAEANPDVKNLFEKMAILPVVCFLIALFFIITGIIFMYCKKPVGIYANMEAPKHWEITDIKKYNRDVGLIFIGYSSLFIASGFIGITDETMASVLLTVSCMPGCIILIILYECVIIKKYKKHITKY